MEKKLSEMDDCGFEDPKPERIKVAVTELAYDNRKLIEILTKRGENMKKENWDAVAENDKQIIAMKNDP